MEGGNGRILLIIVVILVAIVAVIGFGWGKGGQVSAPPVSPGTALPSGTTPAGAKAPADMIPTAISGFDVIAKDTQVKPAYPGEQSAAAISLKPSAGSKYENKVESLTIYVHLFDSAKNATTLATALTTNTTTIERDVSGVKIKLNYKADTGEYILYTQKDKVVGYAFVKPSAKASFLDTATIQEAVILGFGSIKF